MSVECGVWSVELKIAGPRRSLISKEIRKGFLLNSTLNTPHFISNFLSDCQRVSEKIRLGSHFLFALGLELCYLKRVLAAGDY